MKKIAFITRYALFALAATGLNLAVQYLALQLYAGRFSLYLAMAAGTGAGLVLKYLLDKRWIFAFRTSGPADEARRFGLYTLMGVATTALFWGTELLFHALLPQDWAKYLGGAIGLALGYTTKYFLDRRFVFRADI